MAPIPKPVRRKAPPARHTPRPEIIDGGAWEVHESPAERIAHVGWTKDTSAGGIITVPMDDSERARCVRAHELQHVAITPRDSASTAHGLPEVIVQHVEDARVHAHLTASGFDLAGMAGLLDARETSPEAIQAMPRSVRASMVAATYNTGDGDRLASAVLSWDRPAYIVGIRAAEHMHREYGADRATWEDTLKIARYIVQALGNPDGPDNLTGDPVLDDLLAGQLDPDTVEENDTETHGDDLGHMPGIPDLHMVTETPKLTRPIPAKWRTRPKRRTSTKPGRIRRPGRLYRDGAIFAERTKRKGGGAVLIDDSGSMHLEPWEIDALMAAYPAGIIGVYAGSGTEGILRIVARDGMRVANDTDLKIHYGGNAVDVPALLWLEKQPGPRYWVSDAGVDGPAQLLAAVAICKRSSVTRVDRAGDIVGMREA